MSVQFAMMGMAVAGGVLQGLSAASKDAAQADQLRAQGMGQLVKGAETRLNAAEQEQSMWTKALSLLSSNEADSAHRGVGTDPGTSYASILGHNVNVANEMSRRLRFMGESGGKMLDLGAEQSFKASSFVGSQQGMDIAMGIMSGATKAASLGSWGGTGGGGGGSGGTAP
jgi:hypothetical protein